MKIRTLKPLTLIISGAIIIMTVNSLSSAVENRQPDIQNRINQSAQYEGGKFKGNIEALDMSFIDSVSSAYRFIFEDNDHTPDSPVPIQPVDLSKFNTDRTDQLNTTWLGHSSIMIRMNQYRIITDPVFEKKVSIVGPKRFNGDLPLDPEDLSNIDVVVISHDHYDHLNKYSIQLLSDKTRKFIVPLGVGKRLLKWGISRDKIVELDWWEQYRFDSMLSITATPSQHFSGRGITDRNETLWASFVIKNPDFNLFFSGDSGYFKGFKAIGEKYGPFDMTFIECGAYDQRWKPVHMFPEETAQAHLDLKGTVLHPIHWGTFKLALHPWYEPMQRLVTSAGRHGIPVATPVAGQTIVYGSDSLGSAWWEIPPEIQKLTRAD